MGTKKPTKDDEQRGRRTFLWFYRINNNPRYKHVDLAVAVRLTQFINKKTGDAYPSAKTIGEPIGLSERSVLRSVRRLAEGGDVGVEWGAQGRGRSNRYWPILPVLDDEKTGTTMPVSEDVKPAFRARKTGRALPENHKTNHGDPFGVPHGERAATAAAASGVGPEGPPHRRQKGRSGVGGTAAGIGTNGAAVPRPQELATLHGLWDRGHPADATVRQQQADAAAWTAALVGGATPETILVAAQKWIAAADAPRFLPKLSDWLTTHSWGKPPPKRGKQHHRANGAGRRRRSNGVNGSSAIFADVLGGGRARQ